MHAPASRHVIHHDRQLLGEEPRGSPATAVYLVFQPFTRLQGPRRGRQLSQSKDAHKGYCHYSQHSLCGNGARMPHTLGNVSFLDLIFIAPPVAVMQAQSRCLHNGCAIRNPCTTCPPHLRMAPAPERPHLHMAAHRCRIQRVTPNPPGAYIAPTKTGVPPQ